MLINSENLFLIILALVWIVGAVLQDLRRREVDNVWNFSLIALALGYRAFVSVYSWNYWFVLNGVIGLLIFLLIGNLFYYSRLFAGGDAKLLIALGTILPLDYSWIVNFKIFGLFILLFLVLGAFYSLGWALFLVFKNFKRFRKEFVERVIDSRQLFIVCFAIAIIFGIFFWFSQKEMLLLCLILILFPILYVFSKSIEESSMIVSLSPKKVTEGDWLYEDIIVNGKRIKASWDGVSKNELKLIKQSYRKNVLVKQGIPFTPSFLLGFIALIYLGLKYGWMF